MESGKAVIGLLIILLLIVGANFVMYVIVRSWTKGGDTRWLSSLRDAWRKPMNGPASQSMDELRKRVEELEKKKNDE